MSKLKYQTTSQFVFVGKIEKFSLKKGKIKYIKLATEEKKYWIKVAKNIRSKLDREIFPGCKLEVAGTEKVNSKTGKIKLKADSVQIIPQNPTKQDTKIAEKTVPLSPIFEIKKKSKAKVLVCQKSNCWKRGGKEICETLEAKFEERAIADKIPIKRAGCLKKCKQAPNIVILPDKARYSKVKPKQIPALVEKHLIV